MPSESRAQQRFMGAELARKRKGEKTQTGMSEKQLEDFASTSTKGLPEHVKVKSYKRHRPRKHEEARPHRTFKDGGRMQPR